MAPRLCWEAPPAPGGRRRNSGRRLSRPLYCCRRRRARARSSSRSRPPAAGLSRPGHRLQLAVSGGGPGASGPGAREGRARGESLTEHPGERGCGESRRRRGRAGATAGSPGSALRRRHEPAAGCLRPSGRAGAGVLGPARRERAVSADPGCGSDARPPPLLGASPVPHRDRVGVGRLLLRGDSEAWPARGTSRCTRK